MRGRHIATGEHAIVMPLPGGLCVAQFDRLSHPHALGWHLYLRRDFAVVRTWSTQRSPTARRSRAPVIQNLRSR